MIKRIKEAYEYKGFLFHLIYQQLYQRYEGSLLGFLWTLLFPLLIFVSFSIIFSVLNGWDLRDYGLYFFSGYIFWNFFSASSSLAAESIVGNPVYVTRVYVPKILLTVASVAMSLVDLAASLAILGGLMLYFKARFTTAMLFLPVSLLIAIIFVLGLALLFAVANVFLRDFRHLLSSFLFLWFFFSPVLWKASPANARAEILLHVNPIVPLLSLFQMPIWKGQLPPTSAILASTGMGIGLLLIGAVAFFRTERRFYYYL